MTALAPLGVAPDDGVASADFVGALCRVFPAARPDAARYVAVVALLDDGTLETVVERGRQASGDTGDGLWRDDAWRELARVGREGVDIGVVSRSDRTLVPVMLGPVLYGAIDWRGSAPSGPWPSDVIERAAEEFLALIIERVRL